MNYLQKRRLGFFLPVRTLMLTVLVYLMWFFLGIAPEFLIYDRTLIEQGEVWRLLTAHFVHVDTQHLTLNLCALLILGALLEYLQANLFFTALISGVIAVSTGLWFGIESLLYYCGLSGVLNSLLVVAVWQLWLISRDPVVLLLGAASLLKILFEMNRGSALFSSIAWPPLPQAHLLGVLGGIVLLMVLALFDKKRGTPIPQGKE